MASAAQFASLNATALEGETVDFQPSESALTRRSISIFSRRGVEDHPEPRPPFIAQPLMRTPREMTERQKSWMRRRSAPVQSSSPKKPRGTVLNAVPAARRIQMTPLEEEMSNSPNEEILSALESPVSTRLMSASPSSPKSPGYWVKQDGSPSQRSKSTKRKSAHTRIGVWMNGVAHWDENARLDRSIGTEEPSLPETGFTPIQPMPADQLNVLRASRPQLSVVIPGSEPLVNDTTISTIVLNSKMRPRSLVSVAPANIVSKFASTQPTLPEESHVVSPIEEVGAPGAPQIIVEDEDGATKKVSRQSNSSSSEGSLVERDDGSSHSRRSSATSIEVELSHAHALKLDRRTQTGSKIYSIVSPATAGVFDEGAKGAIDVNKPLPPPPVNDDTPEPSPVCAKDAQRLRHVSSTRSEPVFRTAIPKRSWRAIELEPIDSDSARPSSYLLSVSAPSTPTLSQAEHDLEAELSLIENHEKENEQLAKRSSVHRSTSVHSVMHPPERAPTVPRRSRKRDWRFSRNLKDTVVEPAKIKSPRHRKSEADLRLPLDFTQDDAASMRSKRSLHKRASSYELHDIGKAITTGWKPLQEPSTLPQVAYEDGLIVLNGPVTLQKVMDDVVWTIASAEEVLLHILEALSGTTALFNTALINKGMYRVYKENELHLIRTVTRNESPAAWELREWCPPEPSNTVPKSAASSQIEHSPMSYMRGHRRDLDVIERLKAIILERCQTFIRRETASAVSSRSHPEAHRFDDAFFRIWCFCKIFGSNKGREEDVTGQLDWLKGGLLANSSDLSATMNMNLEFEMSSVLLNPPDHFAKGNGGGLSAQQLYDITEIWGCLTSLLQPYLGQTRQAVRCGVYDGCEVFDGDEEREEYLLEEWTAHLLTLGPAVVLEMAELAPDSIAYGFGLAKGQGWTDWTPPQYSGSRTSFLREPVSRLYEERIATASLTLRNPAEREKREMSRKRVATLAAEIRLARQSSTFKRLPLIDQSNERAMSVLSRQGSSASNFSYHSPSHVLARSASVSQRRLSKAPHFSTPRPLETKTLVHSQHRRKISPIIEDKVETFNRMSAQPRFAAAPDTSEVAIKRITEMGFTRNEAQQALRETDEGDGLRLDRAVEILLKRMG